MAKLIYERPKRGRIKYGFRDVTTFEVDLYFSVKDGKLKSQQECINDGKGYSTHSRKKVRTIRAFRRFIKKHKDELPKGGEFILCSRWIGHNVTYKKG